MVVLPWADKTLEVPLPTGWRVLGQFSPPPIPIAADPLAACREALTQPIGTQPLSQRDLRGKRVLIVSDDISRPTPVRHLFPPVREALHQAGVADGDIEVLFALGTHRPMTQEEAEQKIGAADLARHRWHNHNGFDNAHLVHLGQTQRGTPVWLNTRLTEFDLIIPLGSIEPHLLLGFSGGLKMLVPGCAGAKSIGRNHLQGVSHNEFDYVGIPAEHSPMRLDLEEAARMCGREVFIVNAALTPDAQVSRVFCGDPIAAHRAGAQFVREHSEVEMTEQADVVITNSRPFDADLRQGMKAVGNALFAARPGGMLLGFVYCRHGRGDMPVPRMNVPYWLLRRWMHRIGNKRIMKAVQIVKAFSPIEEKFLAHFGLQMLHRNHLSLYSEHLEPDTGRRMGLARQFQDVKKMIEHTEKLVGPTATVAVFPQGGCTYSRGPAT
jgi:nickel-dependent lactate racemase